MSSADLDKLLADSDGVVPPIRPGQDQDEEEVEILPEELEELEAELAELEGLEAVELDESVLDQPAVPGNLTEATLQVSEISSGSGSGSSGSGCGGGGSGIRSVAAAGQQQQDQRDSSSSGSSSEKAAGP
ncbi:hypothetical protein QJQ45_012941 [Haematococcus lacustris]|nr:hypothetical protein QJQ45_012941 [Haematococcus lacustris]